MEIQSVQELVHICLHNDKAEVDFTTAMANEETFKIQWMKQVWYSYCRGLPAIIPDIHTSPSPPPLVNLGNTNLLNTECPEIIQQKFP